MAIFFSALWAAPAHAEDEPPAASGLPAVEGAEDMSVEELIEGGKQAAREGRWEEAYSHFAAAYERKKAYNIAGNLGIAAHILAERRPELYVIAATHLSEALRSFPENAAAEQRAALDERFVDARSRVVGLHVELSPPDACLTVAGRDVGCGPFPHDLYARPGEVTLAARAEGYQPAEQTLEAEAGSDHRLRIALTPVRADEERVTPPPSEPAEESFPLWPGLTAGGLALAAVAAGAGLWIGGDAAADDAAQIGAQYQTQTGDEAFCASPQTAELQAACDDIRGGLERHDTFKDAAVGLFIGGGVLAAGAAALLAVPLSADEDEGDAGVAIAPSGGRHGAMIWARGTW